MIPTHIVDDVQCDRYIARRRLAKAGLFSPVAESADGSEFLERFFGDPADAAPDEGNGPPDLILLDINMPRLDGFETIEELKRRDPATGETPIIALFSSSEHECDLERSRASGRVAHFFTKPIDDTAIGRIIETYRDRGFL